ncbi:hypothetical protein [Maricaulis sp. CAU 1757]
MNKQAATGLAIAGFVVLLISLIIPIYGLYVGGIGLALVTLGAFYGERLFTIITVVVSGVKVLFLSPTFRLMTHQFQEGDSGPVMVWLLVIGAHALPIAALFLAAQRSSTERVSVNEE